MMPYYYDHYMGYGLGWGIFGGVLHILFWTLIVMLIIRIFRHGRHGRAYHGEGVGDTRTHAIDIVRERYAKGEINKQEFEEKMKDLQAHMTK